MGKLIDEIGNRYGMLVVVSRAKNHEGGQARWVCNCDCGNTSVVHGVWLRRGESKSCGCKAWTKLPIGEDAFRGLHAMYKYRGWGLGREKFRELTQMSCHYCGAEPTSVKVGRGNGGNYIYNGIDRIDNTKGYTARNVVPCCPTCNYGKREMSTDEFLEWVERVSEFAYQI